jgi:1,2-diacylglycerol 3-alpha-glucosyltransferase
MKIVHLCLACFYIEGMEYQENVLPRKHRQLGYEVDIITSQFCFGTKGDVFEREVGQYINKDGIKVRIIPYNTKVFGKYARNFRIFSGLYENLDEIKPDIIFCHGVQFNSIGQLITYIREHPNVKLYIDSHADDVNMCGDTWKRKILQKYIWCRQYKKLEPYCEKMWGTLPSRVKYIEGYVKSNKIGLLVMGGDVAKIDSQERGKIRNEVREKYNIDNSTFLIVSGGKIDEKKNVHLLMEAISGIKDKNIKLIIFGELNEKVKILTSPFVNCNNIKMIGWLQPNECYNLFYASDLAVFPGTHSVLWEQVCACGLPALFRGTEGQNHVDMGGNCRFLYEDDVKEIKEKILEVICDRELYSNMKKVAVEKGYDTFSYMEIAKKAIDINA